MKKAQSLKTEYMLSFCDGLHVFFLLLVTEHLDIMKRPLTNMTFAILVIIILPKGVTHPLINYECVASSELRYD